MSAKVNSSGRTVVVGVGDAGIQAVNFAMGWIGGKVYGMNWIDGNVDFVVADTHFSTFEKMFRTTDMLLKKVSLAAYEEKDKEHISYGINYNKRDNKKVYFYALLNNRYRTKKKLGDILKTARKVFVISWVGWGTSYTPGLARSISDMAKKGRAAVDAIALLPLEKRHKYRESIKTSHKIKDLSAVSDHLIMLDSNEIFKKTPKGLTEEDAFRLMNNKVVKQITARMRLS